MISAYGPQRKFGPPVLMSAFGGEADQIMLNVRFSVYDPKQKSGGEIYCDAQHSPEPAM
jgi:hypothetical protein